jgi:RNA polymerase sigma factor (TIGR02999 family)
MDDNQTHHITKLLRAWGDGEQAAYEELAGLVYQELHRIAQRQMRHERKGHTLNPSALVNEAFLKLPAYRRVQWQNRLHFYCLAARLMRRVLINYAKSHKATMNGGGLSRVTLDDSLRVKATMTLEDVLALDEAMQLLAADYERCEQVVELKFFGGLTNEEVAEVLGLGEKTVQRDWSFAQMWLRRALCQ